MSAVQRMLWTVLAPFFLVGLALLGTSPELRAQSVADFYRGKTLHILIGYGEGGGYDIYGRLFAEFMPKHLPGNPTIIPQNMPGAGSFKAVNYLYDVAPRDGTYFGSVAQTLAVDAVTDEKSTIDPTKLPYIGRLATNIDVGVALKRTGIKSFEDARQREIITGTSGGGSTTVLYPLALNAYAGSKFKLVKGYKGTNEIMLAAERGEVELVSAVGIPGLLAAHPDWIKGDAAVILYQNALKRHPLLPQVPTLPELAQSDEGRSVLRAIAGTAEIGRSILTTPGVPPERLAALRTAFQEMVKDPEFLAACQKRNITIEPATGEEMDAITRETKQMPKPVVAALGKLLKEQ
ncbi:MAG TPA: tripartite tricarboxylate transporter substrate-binding protein [Xanthobacteraceae bacterium]|nr:tripartite tricarboxylate transporter substrate-binding protein [Xanthobacteraceae bacterium]